MNDIPSEPSQPLPRLLVVDDDRMSRCLLADLGRSVGMHALTVDSAERALAMVLSERFDLILMDCLMPGMDGYEAARAIRAGGVRTPIVAVTSTCDEDLCEAAGMNYFISKPATRADLRLACEFLQIDLPATRIHTRQRDA